MSRFNLRRPVETILVAKDDASVLAGGAPLSLSNGNVNLADGQLGFVTANADGNNTINTGLGAGDTKVDAPVFTVVQGTDTSADIGLSQDYPIQKRPYEVSGNIVGSNVVSYTGKAFAEPSRSVWTLGSTVGASATEVNIVDNGVYRFGVGYRGRRQDEYHSSTHQVPGMKFEFTAPDYSSDATLNTDALRRNHLLQNLAQKVNLNSREWSLTSPHYGGTEPLVAFAIDVSGGTGTALGSLDAVGDAGTVVNVYTTSGGVQRTITWTADMATAVAEAIASSDSDITTSSTIENINLADAAAGTGTVDQLMFMALNEKEAVKDRNPFIKIRLDMWLNDAVEGGAFAETVELKEVSKAFEGSGTYRQWKIFYDNTAGQRKYHQNRDLYPVIEYPNSLASGAKYDAYIIEHFVENNMDFGNVSRSPHKTIILVPTGDTTTKAAVEGVLNPYMADLGFNTVTL
jgi:hypothetical protein